MTDASCHDLNLLGVSCAEPGVWLNKTATASSYSDNYAITAAPVQGIGVTTPVRSGHTIIRIGLSASSTSSIPTFGAALFPSRLTCTGWEGCNSYGADLGLFDEGDELLISEDDAGAVSLRHNGTLLRKSAASAGRRSWYGVVTFYKHGAWVPSVHLERVSPNQPPQPPLPPLPPPSPPPPALPPSAPLPPDFPDTSPPLVRAMQRSPLDLGQVELHALMYAAPRMPWAPHHDAQCVAEAPMLVCGLFVSKCSLRCLCLALRSSARKQ